MAKEIVNVRLDGKALQRVDLAVRRGTFPNRSEAIRSMVAQFIREHPEAFDDPLLSRIVHEPPLSDEMFEEIAAQALSGEKTAADLVAEGRQRG
ncbi:MAG: ribbon-helix-helix domain-containing protein [Thermoplasmata archaeon]